MSSIRIKSCSWRRKQKISLLHLETVAPVIPYQHPCLSSLITMKRTLIALPFHHLLFIFSFKNLVIIISSFLSLFINSQVGATEYQLTMRYFIGFVKIVESWTVLQMKMTFDFDIYKHHFINIQTTIEVQLGIIIML